MNDEAQQGKQRPPFQLAVIIFAAFALLYLLSPQVPQSERRYEIPYSEFKLLLRERWIEEVQLRGDIVEGLLTKPKTILPNEGPIQRFRTRVPAFGDDSLLPELENNGVEIRVSSPVGENTLSRALISIIPWLLFIAIFIWLMRRAARNISGQLGGSDELKGFLGSSSKEAKIPEITFADVAGQENAKREIAELVEYLKDPERFRKLGAEIPHGTLLMGAPGTGKTLLARALAGEAGVPFYSISASEFIEVFVGVGASRVRNLFKAAKKHPPSIIFIDELDSVGRTRGTGLGGGNDEREQTLNQILAEMDGFGGHEAILILAATNRPDVLDPALLRPGRFDRHITLDLPERKDRIAILKVHIRNSPIDADVDLDKVAAGTPGFSGADLKNLVNEAAILAARHREQTITMADFDEARDKVMMGAERSLAIQPEERHRLAVHEAGHTLLAHFLPNSDALYKVTIVPRGHALGATHQLPEHERHTLPQEYLQDRLAIILGGRTAEKELLGSLSSGADDDIHQATLMARAMVSRWGMSEEVGPVDLRESEEHPFLGREMAQPRHYSEHSAEIVDDATRHLLLDAEKQATHIIQQHIEPLKKLIIALEENETLYQKQIEACLGPATIATRKIDDLPNNSAGH